MFLYRSLIRNTLTVINRNLRTTSTIKPPSSRNETGKSGTGTTTSTDGTAVRPPSLHPEQIASAIERTPELKEYKLELWHNIHKVFYNQGFNTIGFLKMITIYPSILYIKPNDLIKRIECWRNAQLGERNLQSLFEECPKLLEFNDIHRLRERIGYLLEFVGNENNVQKILKMSPNLLTDNSKIIKVKFQYLTEHMKIEIPEIIKSETMSCSMEKIECRHEFVERLGIFKAKLKENPLDKSSNPKLYQIMDTSDKKFATKLCFVTLDEYETFQQLFKREKLKSKQKNFNYEYDDYDEHDGDNDDDDDDDDNNDGDNPKNVRKNYKK